MVKTARLGETCWQSSRTAEEVVMNNQKVLSSFIHTGWSK